MGIGNQESGITKKFRDSRFVIRDSLYLHPRILTVAVLGFTSGLPLALTASTLAVWLAEAGIAMTAIGLFAAIGTPYALKFLWAPLVDQSPLPWLTRKLGRRRGWLVLSQLLLMLALLLLGLSHPADNIWMTATAALIVAVLSATQDIVIDAYRVEILEEKQQGAGAAIMVFGYRIGMLASGAGALLIAESWGWFVSYSCMALLILPGMAVVLLAGEPASIKPIRHESWVAWFNHAVIKPFSSFTRHAGWWLILLFVIFYKFGDAFAGVMTNPFLVDVGFTKSELATIVKTWGLAATLIGAFLGGSLVHRLGIWQSLWLGGLLQMGSNLMFVWQAHAGHDLFILAAVIAVENLAGGMGTAAFVAYISMVCQREYTATQYALLSALAATGRTWLSAASGGFAETMGWSGFFMFSTVLALPGLLLLSWLRCRR